MVCHSTDMANTTHPEGITCGWLIEVAYSGPEFTAEDMADPDWEPWYPDFPGDTTRIIECGGPVDMDSRHALCDFHQGAMDMDGLEFERLSESHDGHAFS